MIVIGVNTARALVFPFGEGRINERQVDRIVQRLAAIAAVDAARHRHASSVRSAARRARAAAGRAKRAWRWRGWRRRTPICSCPVTCTSATSRMWSIATRSAGHSATDRAGRHGLDARPRRSSRRSTCCGCSAGDRAVAPLVGRCGGRLHVIARRPLRAQRARLGLSTIGVRRVKESGTPCLRASVACT